MATSRQPSSEQSEAREHAKSEQQLEREAGPLKGSIHAQGNAVLGRILVDDRTFDLGGAGFFHPSEQVARILAHVDHFVAAHDNDYGRARELCTIIANTYHELSAWNGAQAELMKALRQRAHDENARNERTSSGEERYDSYAYLFDNSIDDTQQAALIGVRG